MNKIISILGDINKKGEFEISSDKTIKEVLNEYAGGMKNRRNVKLVQVGGPLGICINGKDLNKKMSDYKDYMNANMIMFLGDLLCPVDYLRFLTRFMVRELRLDNKHIRKLNHLLENIAGGIATECDFEELINEVNKEAGTNAEDLLHKIFIYITSEFKDEFMDHIIDKKCKNGICRGLMIAQCMNACPAEVYIPGYIELMKHDRVEEAYDLMRKNNPLSFVCGKVCARPCEDRCRRGEIESTVGVRALKRYACDMTLKMRDYKEDKLDSNGKKVAIVGAGPSGLTAAYYLAKTGYQVVIYEAAKVIGGMLAMGIPEYRLPQETIDKEVKLIKGLGVKIVTNTKVGIDITLKELREKFDSLLLSTGCHIGNKFGPDIKDIETAVDFLRKVKVQGRRTIGENVLVIGGGDVAMDAARTSIRLGAKNVILASLETFETMPASDEEKNEAVEEGVQFVNGYGTKDINVEDGKLKGITLKRCLSILDDEGRFSPVYDEEDLKTFEIDSLILAIGQRPDNSYLDEDIELDERGWIKVEKYTFETSSKGIFAAGDMYKPGIAIKAIAEAKKAAIAIDKYLGGDGLYLGKEIEIPEKPLNCTIWDIEKVVEKHKNPSQIKGNFDTVSRVYTKDEANKEVSRCMRCDRNSTRPLYLK
ncbi:FAD-dependent oxidoreductase [Tepidibacter hydrothermalis]|uniref:dihydrouracil dehydrogenase (NAD(+)) n=1 Tax=Tepidibacter hydrothermalis TaxID=3036126 RepID=A0ABY8EIV2_9FIRM|nr:FAD-dependent oxidoreductase [Tepidibacter hydrothermalis]WFD11950.1 FAD-dependent oxidoreductase [Tepidibacter hydrothermalis]